MAFDRLLATYGWTRAASAGGGESAPFAQPELDEVVSVLGGVSLENGLYRVHSRHAAARWAVLVADNFPAFAGRAWPFGSDWLGRQFAADRDREGPSGHLCLLLEPALAKRLSFR